MTNFLKKLFSKKPIPEVGSCFMSDGECYKTFPSKTTIKDMIIMTDTTCQKNTIWKDEFLKKHGDYTIIEREIFDQKADEFIKEQVKLSLGNEESRLLITRIKQCCPEWFEKHYGNTKTNINKLN